MTDSLLFLLLRLGLGNAAPSDEDLQTFSSLDADGWKALIDLTFDAGVESICVDGYHKCLDSGDERMVSCLLETDEALEDLKFEWFGSVLQDEQTHSRQVEVLKDMEQKFASNGIRVLLLKGLGLGEYYPVPSHRPCGDIDIYLFSDYEKGNQLVETAGAVVDTSWYKHSQIHYEDEMFENHQYFVHTRDGKQSKELNATLCRLLENQSFKKYPGTEVLLPSTMFNALFLTYHALAHFVSEGLRMRQVTDWAMFLKAEQDNIDWPEFYRLCDRFHFRRFVDVMNDIALHKLGVKLSNPAITTESPYTGKVFHSLLHDKDYVFSSGKGGWTNRLHLVTNMFKYSWKYHQIYQKSILVQLWYYASGYILKTEK